MNRAELPLVLRGGRVVDPATGVDEVADLWIDEDGVHRSPPGASDGWQEVDVVGLVVSPAFVELHAHLREPGGEESETIATGLAAARAGGYGHVLVMANTSPVNDAPEVTERMLAAAERSGTGVTLYPVTAATIGLAGREAAPWEAQIGAGCVAISDDGHPVADPAVLAHVLAGAARLGVPYLSHAERPELFGGVMHAGPIAERLDLRGVPSRCESDAVELELAAAERAAAPIHFCHLSTEASLVALAKARDRGVRATAEATPHHLLLTADQFAERGPDPDLKMNPPLRTEADARALRAALRSGLVGAVATDHAPHAPALKAAGIEDAPFGVIGMENAFAVVCDRLLHGDGWGLSELLEKFTSGPARIAGLAAGRLFDGPPAVTLLDVEGGWEVRPATFRSRSRNCPFAGRRGRGRVVATLLGGRLEPSPGLLPPEAP